MVNEYWEGKRHGVKLGTDMATPGHIKQAKLVWFFFSAGCLTTAWRKKKGDEWGQKVPQCQTKKEINFVSIKTQSNVLCIHVQSPLCLSVFAGSSTHQLLFHVCRTWGSWMLCLSACSSRKSNMYLMASGRALPRWAVLKIVSNKSSTNFCNVPY